MDECVQKLNLHRSEQIFLVKVKYVCVHTKCDLLYDNESLSGTFAPLDVLAKQEAELLIFSHNHNKATRNRINITLASGETASMSSCVCSVHRDHK